MQQLIGRTLRVDHCRNYKPVDSDEEEEKRVKRALKEGREPSPPHEKGPKLTTKELSDLAAKQHEAKIYGLPDKRDDEWVPDRALCIAHSLRAREHKKKDKKDKKKKHKHHKHVRFVVSRR